MLNDLIHNFKTALGKVYDKNEAYAITKLYFLDKWKIDIYNTNNKTIFEEKIILNDLKKLLEYVPLQYVLGFCYFNDLKINVNNNVLIPRPETEEMVEIAKSLFSKQSKLNIVDFCTGSGCIALALKKYFYNAHITGIDVCANAIATARENAKNNNLELNFIEANILENFLLPASEKFNLIISNPPYIPIKEKQSIKENVLQYEPHLALFVPNSNEYIFYEKIMQFAQNNLSANGKILFETNSKYPQPNQELLNISKKYFSTAEINHLKDMSGNYRFLIIETE